ncbi:MAG: Ig-like domain-containing protein [Myxococcota bacterium]
MPLRLLPAALRALLLLAATTLSFSPTPAPPVVPPAAPAIDFSAVMRQVHFAWRADGAGHASSHATFEAHLEGSHLRFVPRAGGVEGDALELGESRLSRGGVEFSGGPLRITGSPTGGLWLAHPGVLEALHSGEAGVEQTWRFEDPPQGTGALDVVVPVVRGAFLGETEGGLHFAAGALAVSYGHGTWVDAAGRRTAIPARFEDGAIHLSVPEELLDASAFPAVLDPVIGPELSMGTPVPSPVYAGVSAPDVASDGSNFLVVWHDDRTNLSTDIYGMRLTAGGAPMDPAGIAISTAPGAQSEPRVAWDGANFLVVWEDARGTDLDIYAARVSSGGAVREPQGIQVSTAMGAQRRPDVFTRGTGAFIAWEDFRLGLGASDIYGTRVSGSGGVQDPTGIPIATNPTDERLPAVAWDGTNVLVAWDDRRNGNADIYATRVDPAGAVLDGAGIAVSMGAGAQTEPAATFAGSAFVVAWRDERNGNADVYASRVSSAGVALDATGIGVGVGAGEQTRPSLASSATNAVLVWRDVAGGQLRGARINSTGAVLDSPGVALAPDTAGTSGVALAYSSTNALMAWNASGQAVSQVRALRVTPSLMPLGTPVVASQSANHQQLPAVAWGGPDALVVWADYRSGVDLDLYATRVSRAGTVLDPAGIAVATATSRQNSPDVAWDGANFLVVWEEGDTSSDSDIFAARVSPAGVVLDATPLTVSQAAGAQLGPAVGFDGMQWLVVWTDRRAGATEGDIYGARVSGAGAVLDSTGVAISAATGGQFWPDVAFDGANSLVVWTDQRAGVGAEDLFGARVTTAGAVLDATGLPLVTASGVQQLPALARLGNGDLLLTWTDSRSGTPAAYATRVTSSGTVLDGTGVVLSGSTAAFETDVAWDGANALVVMGQGLSTQSDVTATRVSPAGVVLDTPPLSVSSSTSQERAVAVACDGTRQCLVLWQGFDTSAAAQAYRVFARPVTRGEAPVATAQNVMVDEDMSLAITLAGTDADGDALSFRVVTQPMNGALSGTPPTVTFTPTPDFNGLATFTFVAHDGILDSAPATVTVGVRPVNDAPTATPGVATVVQGVSMGLTLRGVDIDGDGLSFAVQTQPGHGTVSVSGSTATYTSEAGYTGADSFTFVANDGTVDSAPATFTLTVTPSSSGGGSGGGGGGGGSGGGGGGAGVDAGVGGGAGGGSGGGGCSCAGGGEGMVALGVLLGLLRRTRRRRC